MTQSPRLEEVMECAVGERLRTFFTALPAEVVSFDHNTDKATIRVRVTNSIEDSTGDKVWHQPTLQNIPVQFPGSGKNRITFPISAGDKVIYIVSTLPLHEYLNKGSSNLDVDPVTFNNLGSGWIVPGIPLTPPTETPTDAMVIHVTNMLKLGGPTDTEPTVRADTLLSRFDDFLQVLESEINVLVPGVGTTIRNAWVVTGIRSRFVEVK